MAESGSAQAIRNCGEAKRASDRSALVGRAGLKCISRPEEFLVPDAAIRVDVGIATLTRGGWIIHEDQAEAGVSAMTVAEAEVLAQRAPEQEWLLHLFGAGGECHYRRVGPAASVSHKWGNRTGTD